MSVNNNVDFIFFEYSKACLCFHRPWGTEKDIRNIRRDHRAAPAIAERNFQSAQKEIVRIMVNSHVGAVHSLCCLSINASRDYAPLFPSLLSLLRCSLYKIYLALLPTKILKEFKSHISCDILDGSSAAEIDTEYLRNLIKFSHVRYPEILCFSIGNGE